MAIKPDTGDDTQTRHAWMIDEFRRAQQRRRSKAVEGAVEPSARNGATGDADAPAKRGHVVIPQS